MSSIKFKDANNKDYVVHIGKTINNNMRIKFKLEEVTKEMDLKRTPDVVSTIRSILIEETKNKTIEPVDENKFWAGFSEKKYDYYGDISSNYFASHNHIPNEVLNLRSVKRYKELRRNFNSESKALTVHSKKKKLSTLNSTFKKVTYIALVASVCFVFLNNYNAVKREVASISKKVTLMEFFENKKKEFIDLFLK